MSRHGMSLFGLALLLTGSAACTPGEADVVPNEQVAAEDRTEAAPSGGETSAPEGPIVSWAAGNDIAWDEAPSEAPAGPITVELTCAGLVHNVTFEDVNGEEPVVQCDTEGTFTGGVELEAGTYTYYCSIPGHPPGMTGELTVA